MHKVHNSILVTDYLTKMGINTVPQPPYSPDLVPCDFWLIDMLTQEDFHGGLPDVVGMVQQVHCSRRRLLRRRLEFHVCTLDKSAYTKKVWKLI